MQGENGSPLIFDKQTLIEKVSENRDNHRAQFEEALEGWQKAVETRLTKMLDDARKGRKIDEYISLPRPDDHTKDYDRVILMMEMSNTPWISLNEKEFAQYVQDDWGWKEQFLATNSMYTQPN